MNLWVRSQDKNKLVPINDELYIPNSRTGEDFGIFYKDKMLGYYKTKERALEVLDEIQNMLYIGLHTNNNQLAGTTSIVYEMPKE